jgi:hypothetical protein
MQINLLTELGTETLVQSPQGFLLLFQGRNPDAINRQLRYFDIDEWRPGLEIEKTFERELEGLAPAERFRDSEDILKACPDRALSLLNHDVLDITGPNLEFYNLMHSTNPFRVRARIQALTVLPMLKWEFCGMNKETDRIRRRIDDGKSVWDSFLETHPGKASVLRRIASTKSSPEVWRGNLAGLLALLEPLPPEKIPASDKEWNAFHSIFLALGLDRASHDYRENHEERLQLKHRWLNECARMGWEKAYERFAAFEGGVGALTDTFDFLDEIRDAGNHLASQSGEDWQSAGEWKNKSRERWLKAPNKFGMFRLVEYSVRWHRDALTEAGFSSSVESQRSTWPCLLSQPVELAPGFIAVSLGNADALTEEGRRMKHCVGSYWRHCFLGNSHIISLRDAGGNPLSTLEISVPQNGSNKCEIVQHRAKQNKTPAAELRALEGRLKAVLNRQSDFKALSRWRENAAKLDGLLRVGELHALSRGYDKSRLKRLAAVLGGDRLSDLFKTQDPGVSCPKHPAEAVLPNPQEA